MWHNVWRIIHLLEQLYDKTVKMTLDEKLLAAADRATSTLHTNRSAFIRAAL